MRNNFFKRMNKFKYYKIILLVICIAIIGIVYKQCLQRIENNLKLWEGKYTFSESNNTGYPAMVMVYNIEICEVNPNDYYAYIEIDGQTTLARIQGKVFGDEEWISLVFEKFLPGHIIGGTTEKNGVLLSFRKDNENMYTYWGTIQPMLYENEQSGKIYFVKSE